MKTRLFAIPLLALVLLISGCAAPTGGRLGDSCRDKYDCSDVGACGGEDFPICTDGKCACPTEPDAMDLLDQATNQIFCNKNPYNEIWTSCDTIVKGFYYNSETNECEYYEGNGCSSLFETETECEFTCQ